MADTADADSATPNSPQPIQSIEVETEVKAEEGGDDDAGGSGNDVDEEGGTTAGDEPPVSTEQYKALKNIAEVLTNFKVKVKGDE